MFPRRADGCSLIGCIHLSIALGRPERGGTSGGIVFFGADHRAAYTLGLSVKKRDLNGDTLEKSLEYNFVFLIIFFEK